MSSNLNPTAPVFLPAHFLPPVPFFIPTRIYFPFPPPPPSPPPPPPHRRFFTGAPPSPTSLTPTRAILFPICDVTETSLRRDLEVFGDIRGIQIERAEEEEGIVIVTVYFYNLKDSQRALTELRYRHMHHHQEQVLFGRGYTAARGLVSGRILWPNYVFPQLTAVTEGNNQGSLVVMNLEPTVSSVTLRRIFEVYGEVKEIRETPNKREQRFVEFYDVRDAAKALREMNGKSIGGKEIVVQFSRPGGFNRKLFLSSRFNKSFHYNNHRQPPPPPPYHRRRLYSPVKAKPYNNNTNRKRSNKKNSVKKSVSDGCFAINGEAIIAGDGEFGDDRTTVMIKNIPNKYTQEMFLNMLDSHCKECNQKVIEEEGNNNNSYILSSYDFVYVPIDFRTKCNMGYGFVNMTSPEAVLRLYKSFHNQHWGNFSSRKICEVTYARIQGLEMLKEHFKNSKLPGVETEKYMPVLFSPPRDGRLLTEAITVVDFMRKPIVEEEDETVLVTSCSSSDKDDDDDGKEAMVAFCCETRETAAFL